MEDNLPRASFSIEDTHYGSNDTLISFLTDEEETISTSSDRITSIKEKTEVENPAAPTKAVKKVREDDDDEEELSAAELKKKLKEQQKLLEKYLKSSESAEDNTEEEDDNEATEDEDGDENQERGGIPSGSGKESEEEDDSNPETGESNLYPALAQDLAKIGVFSPEEGEDLSQIDAPEKFSARFNSEINKRSMNSINQFIGQFGEDYQRAFEAIYVKGLSPREFFGSYNKIESYSDLDLGSEMNQEMVVREMLQSQEFEPEDIASEVERLRNSGDLESVAQRYQKVLIKKEAANLVQKEQESASRIEQKKQAKSQYFNNVDTVLKTKLANQEFDGIPLNVELAKDIKDFLVVDKYQTPSGETLTEFDKFILDLKNPENHEKKVKVALLMKLLEKDPTLSTIQKRGVTKKTDSLFSELTRQTSKASTNNGGSKNTKSSTKTNPKSSWDFL